MHRESQILQRMVVTTLVEAEPHRADGHRQDHERGHRHATALFVRPPKCNQPTEPDDHSGPSSDVRDVSAPRRVEPACAIQVMRARERKRREHRRSCSIQRRRRVLAKESTMCVTPQLPVIDRCPPLRSFVTETRTRTAGRCTPTAARPDRARAHLAAATFSTLSGRDVVRVEQVAHFSEHLPASAVEAGAQPHQSVAIDGVGIGEVRIALADEIEGGAGIEAAGMPVQHLAARGVRGRGGQAVRRRRRDRRRSGID